MHAPPPPGPVAVPYYQMGMNPGMPGVAGEAVQPYQATGASGSILYQSVVPPTFPQSHQHHAESQASSHRYSKPESPRHHQHQHAPQSSMGSSTGSPVAQHHSPSRQRPPDPKSPIQAKHSPLSLASITTPYPDQPKNYHAQMLMLGERLRPEYQVVPLLEGPASVIPSCETSSIPHPSLLRRYLPPRVPICTSTRVRAPRRRVGTRRSFRSSPGIRGGEVIPWGCQALRL